MTEQLKLCKDCKYYDGFISEYSAECRHQDAIYSVDPIIGYIHRTSCVQMRIGGVCGNKAKLFEPRPPGFFTRMWNRLFGKDTQQ